MASINLAIEGAAWVRVKSPKGVAIDIYESIVGGPEGAPDGGGTWRLTVACHAGHCDGAAVGLSKEFAGTVVHLTRPQAERAAALALVATKGTP
jgi:hypothetical protein